MVHPLREEPAVERHEAAVVLGDVLDNDVGDPSDFERILPIREKRFRGGLGKRRRKGQTSVRGDAGLRSYVFGVRGAGTAQVLPAAAARQP